MKRRLTALLLVLLCLPLTACQKQQNLYSATWFDLFDTVAIVQAMPTARTAGTPRHRLCTAIYSAITNCLTSTTTMMRHQLYDVNARAAAAPVQVSDELYAFLRWCKDTAYLPPTARRTSPQVRCCAVARCAGKRLPCPPDADVIAAALAHIDIEGLVLDDAAQTVYFADPEMALDVGAVGKATPWSRPPGPHRPAG